jgi:hypothetical protein
VRIGEEFEVVVKIINSANETKDFTVYSYVFKGKKPVSEGLVGGKWSSTRNANKKVVVIEVGKSKTITLVSRIEAGTEPSNYTLKVRIKGEKDSTREIAVLPPLPVVKADLSCERINDTVRLVIKNLGPATEFDLIAFPGARNY